jgi:hypothetical protein
MQPNRGSPSDQPRHWHGPAGNRYEHHNVWVIGGRPQKYVPETPASTNTNTTASASNVISPAPTPTPSAAIENANMSTRRVTLPPSSIQRVHS